MARNLVVCCDGTGNQFGPRDSNVIKLCRVMVRDPATQVVYYDPGVGTLGDQRAITRMRAWLTRALGGAIGFGLRQNIEEAYDFLSATYQPGDRVYLFGFSRGAYCARALAALIHMYGLADAGMRQLTPYLTTMIFGRDRADRFRVARDFRRTFGRTVPIDFVGLWDTVSSVGWFWNPVSLPYTACNPSIRCVRHAVSIDERRAFFRQNLLKSAAGQDLKEVWFAGVHSDVGGGYSNREQGLAQIPFAWMLREAERCGLVVDPGRRSEVLAGDKYPAPDPRSDQHNSLTWKWWAMEFVPKPRRMCWKDEDGKVRWDWPFRINLFRRRSMRPEATIHRSVLDRSNDRPAYRPRNLGDPTTHGVEE